jgi:hypothetical protein
VPSAKPMSDRIEYRVLGCLCFAHLTQPQIKMVSIGISTQSRRMNSMLLCKRMSPSDYAPALRSYVRFSFNDAMLASNR